jgi:hypothetical protein
MKARRSWYALTLAALLALGASSGCSRARNDAQVANEVQGKINTDSSVPSKQITVAASNGIVTLSGNVGSETERQAAANDAAQVEGVKTVVNNLQVATAQAASEAEPKPKPSRAAARTRRTSPKVHRARSANKAASSAPASTPVVTPSAPATTAMAPAAPPPPAPPPPPPTPVTVADGTVLQVRMIDSVDSASNQPGDRFRATLDAPITIDDKVIVPQGADIEGHVAELKGAGKFSGKPAIALELTALSVNGRRYSLHTSQYSREGSSRGKNTAEKVGGGAVLGSIIGAIAGGGKGAAIGGVVGAGAGGGVQAASKAPQIHVASESLLSFTLQNPITVMPASSIQRGRSSRSADNNRTADYNDTDQQPQQESQSKDDPNGPVLKRR